MAAELISATHTEILRLLASNTGIHFQGLAQAARTKQLGLSTKTRRHLTTLDVAHNLVRHITSVSAKRLVQEVTQATSNSEHPGKPPGTFQGGVPGAATPVGPPSDSPGLLWGGIPGPLPSPPCSQQAHGTASTTQPEVQLTGERTRIKGDENHGQFSTVGPSRHPSRIDEHHCGSPTFPSIFDGIKKHIP